MKTMEEVVAELVGKYDKAEVDRLVAAYRREAILPIWRKAEEEVTLAEQRTKEIVERLRGIGALDALDARNERDCFVVPMEYRYRFG